MRTHIVRLRAILLGGSVVLLLGFLLWKTRTIDTDAHGRFTDDLRQLKQLDINLETARLECESELIWKPVPLEKIPTQIKLVRSPKRA